MVLKARAQRVQVIAKERVKKASSGLLRVQSETATRGLSSCDYRSARHYAPQPFRKKVVLRPVRSPERWGEKLAREGLSRPLAGPLGEKRIRLGDV
jgi:hypothetical protein